MISCATSGHLSLPPGPLTLLGGGWKAWFPGICICHVKTPGEAPAPSLLLPLLPPSFFHPSQRSLWLSLEQSRLPNRGRGGHCMIRGGGMPLQGWPACLLEGPLQDPASASRSPAVGLSSCTALGPNGRHFELFPVQRKSHSLFKFCQASLSPHRIPATCLAQSCGHHSLTLRESWVVLETMPAGAERPRLQAVGHFDPLTFGPAGGAQP